MKRNSLALSSIALVACLLIWPLTVTAETPKTVKIGDRGSVPVSPLDDEMISPGVKLAQQHLGELLPVLAHLRDHEPEQYEKAIRDLDRAAKRLESLQRRDATLYDVALREWQTRGRIDLLKARLRVRRSQADARHLLVQMRLLREIEIDRLGRERHLIAERESLMSQRAAQAQQVVERSRRQIEQLEQQIARLVAQPIGANSPAYLRAIGPSRGSDRRAEPASPANPTDPSVPAKKSRASQ